MLVSFFTKATAAATATDKKNGYDRIENPTVHVDNTIGTKANTSSDAGVSYNLRYKIITLLMVFVIAVSYGYSYSAVVGGSNVSADTGLPAAAAAYLNGGDSKNTGTSIVLYSIQDVINDANNGSYNIVDPSMEHGLLFPAKIVGASTGSDAFPLDDNDKRKNAKSGNFKTFFNDPKYEFHRTLAYMNDQVSGHGTHTIELKNRGYSIFTLDGVASVGSVDGFIQLFKKAPTSNEHGIVVIVCEGARKNPSDVQDEANIYLWGALVEGPINSIHNEPHRFSVAEDVAKKVYDAYGGAGSEYRIFTTGHSLGGATSANLAATRPDLVETAVVFDPFSWKLYSNQLENSLAGAKSHPNWAAKTLREKIMVSRGGSTGGGGGGVIVHRFVTDTVSKYNLWGLQFSWKYNANQKMPKDGIIPGFDGNLTPLGSDPSHNMCHFIKDPNAENCGD